MWITANIIALLTIDPQWEEILQTPPLLVIRIIAGVRAPEQKTVTIALL